MELLASSRTVVLGSFAFLVFWVTATFPKFLGLPIGRTAGAIVGATLMVVFQIDSPDEAYASINLPILGLLFGTMVVSVYLQRADMFKYLASALSYRCQGGKDLLCRLSFLVAFASALFTNDTCCVLFTEFILAFCKEKGLPPEPFLLALATSANIGSSATPIGNPQNLVIAIQSKISFGRFLMGIFPAMVVGVTLNLGLLLAMYWKQLSTITVCKSKLVAVVDLPQVKRVAVRANTQNQQSSRDIEAGKDRQTSTVAFTNSHPSSGSMNGENSQHALQRAISIDTPFDAMDQQNSRNGSVTELGDMKQLQLQHCFVQPHDNINHVKRPSSENVNNTTGAGGCSASVVYCMQASGSHDPELASELAQKQKKIIRMNIDDNDNMDVSLPAASCTKTLSTDPASSESSAAHVVLFPASCSHVDKGSKLVWKARIWKLCVYLVTIGMLAALLAGLDLSWCTITAAIALIVLDFEDAAPSLSKVSYSLLVFFSGMFITVNGFNRTGLPGKFWSVVEPHARINHASGTAVLTAVVILLSNVASNVPTVLLLGPKVAASSAALPGSSESRAWLILAWASTVAGNLTLVGSAANLIVCEQARMSTRMPYNLSFLRHLKFGFPSTLLIVAIGLPLIRVI